MEILQQEIILHGRIDTTKEIEKILKAYLKDHYTQEEILWCKKYKV
jgi:hypothetical protein